MRVQTLKFGYSAGLTSIQTFCWNCFTVAPVWSNQACSGSSLTARVIRSYCICEEDNELCGTKLMGRPTRWTCKYRNFGSWKQLRDYSVFVQVSYVPNRSISWLIGGSSGLQFVVDFNIREDMQRQSLLDLCSRLNLRMVLQFNVTTEAHTLIDNCFTNIDFFVANMLESKAKSYHFPILVTIPRYYAGVPKGEF